MYVEIVTYLAMSSLKKFLDLYSIQCVVRKRKRMEKGTDINKMEQVTREC